MICVSTPAGKRALAEALAEHDPEHLDFMKMIGAGLGPFDAVSYESRRPSVTAAIAADVAKARAVYVHAGKARQQEEMRKIRELLN